MGTDTTKSQHPHGQAFEAMVGDRDRSEGTGDERGDRFGDEPDTDDTDHDEVDEEDSTEA